MPTLKQTVTRANKLHKQTGKHYFVVWEKYDWLDMRYDYNKGGFWCIITDNEYRHGITYREPDVYYSTWDGYYN